MEHTRLVDEDIGGADGGGSPLNARRLILTRNILAVLLGLAIVSLIGVSIALGIRSNETRATPDSQSYDRSDDFPLKFPEAWDISADHPRKIEFDTTEGTWLNIDVSPDGKTIVFDMLGDLYTLPIGGGQATLLKGGVAFDTQPRWSPSGQYITFTSDQSGCDNIWVMEVATKTSWPVTNEPYHFLSNPFWTNESSIVAVKWYTSERSLGGGEIWSYTVPSSSSNGDAKFSNLGTRIIGRVGFGSQVGPEEPIAGSADGRSIFYSKNTADSTVFNYNKDPHAGIYSIFKFDLATGTTTTISSGPGGAARPILNRARSSIAFIRRTKYQTSLMIQDLKTGTERIIWNGLDFDQQESYAPSGVYPSFCFTPDDSAVLVWSKGHIWRVSTTMGSATMIPFTARVSLDVSPTARFTQKVSSDDQDGKFTTKVVLNPSAPSDSSAVYFESVGTIYRKQLSPDGSAAPVPFASFTDSTLNSNPHVSGDGQWLSYVSWSDQTLATIQIASTTGPTKYQVPEEPGRFVRPTFSPNNNMVGYIKLSGDVLSGGTYFRGAGVYWRSVDLTAPNVIWGPTKGPVPGRHIAFSTDGKYAHVLSGDYPKSSLVRYDVATLARLPLASSTYATDIRISPDESYIAFVEFRSLFLAKFKMTDGPMNVTSIGSSRGVMNPSVRKVWGLGADFMSWSVDGSKLRWGWGGEFYEASAVMLMNCGASDVVCISNAITIHSANVTIAADIAPTYVVFENATLVTMDDSLGIIENGRIVVRNGRIQDLGPAQMIPVPTEAQVIDVNGGYILPGFIDAHAHWIGAWASEYKVKNSWEFFVNLAFGVTTLHNPSADTISIFRDAEYVRAGSKVGPRIFSTGQIIYGAGSEVHCDISSVDDAKEFLTQLKRLGGWSVKSYNQPCRAARQKILTAARELKMSVVPEGGMAFWWNLNQIIDGHTTIEHAIPMAPLYRDVVQLFSQSGTAWTPTLIVNYGGIFGERYWYQNTKVFEDERLMTFAPEDVVYPITMRRVGAEDVDYHHFETARSVKSVVDNGGFALAGAHGEMQGLGYHWELRMFKSGNMSNLDVLKAGTVFPAKAHGLFNEIGSLAKGKLADLVFYDANHNPLEDIWNAAHVMWVMKDGHMWNARDMAQILPVAKPAPQLPELNTKHV